MKESEETSSLSGVVNGVNVSVVVHGGTESVFRTFPYSLRSMSHIFGERNIVSSHFLLINGR